MAVVVLRPSGDGTTTGWTREPASGTFASKIQEVVSENDGDTSYVQSPNASTSAMFVELDDVPADFDPSAINSIVIRVAHRRLNDPVGAIDGGTVGGRIDRANESTQISTGSSANSPIQAQYQQNQLFVNVSGAHTVSDWNGARLRLTFSHSANEGVDTVNRIRITAAEVEVDYEPMAGDPPGPINDLDAVAFSATQVDLTWTPASGADAHRIYRRLV